MGCNFTATTGISLSTLTDWIWKRATDIKTRSNDLSNGLFDYVGYPLDQREQKELGFLTRQLKLLADLLNEVLRTGKRYIPDKVYLNLETQHKSIRMASEYQDVLLWLLNIGLLPERQLKRNSYGSYKLHATDKGDSNDNFSNTIQYPYKDLKNLYVRRRDFFGRANETFISKKTGSCRLLYIDALIAHECKGDSLRECWLENGGNGLYPPPSIEAMLRVLLVPEMEFESKCAMLLYFFLDLHMIIDEQTHKEVVQSFVKFPSVFKLTAPLIKTVQSLWNLDHGLFVPAVDEFISPFNNNQTYTQWMLELLIESLLTQNAADFALRILEARPTLISPILKLKTLLANDLISEAFHFARTKHDDTLVELFFKCCLCTGKYGVIRDLALNEREGQLVQRILRSSKTHGAENLHFVYLLQKSKYIEAVSYLDELSHAKNMCSHYGNESSSIVASADTPNLMLSAFNTTMAPVTQGLADVYFRIKNKIKKKETDNRSPVPLSCQLIKQNANNLLGGIYHSSALSAHFATYYWGEMHINERHRDTAAANVLLSANNAPFLRKPQVEACHLQMVQSPQHGVSYPQPYKLPEKRTLIERVLEQDDVPAGASIKLSTNNVQPRKRRRLAAQEIVEELGHFMQLNKSTSQLTASGFDLKAACESQAKSSEMTSSKIPAPATTEYLTQPLTTPRRRLAAVDNSRIGLSLSATGSAELHSILKTSNTPERIVRAQSARRELHTAALDESKNLRFKLPATEIVLEKYDGKALETPEQGRTAAGSRRVMTITTVVDELVENVAEYEISSGAVAQPAAQEMLQEDIDMVEDDVVDEVLIEVRHVKPFTTTPSPAKQKVVACALSVDSNATQGNKNSESEEEDFYSPLSSRNNSLMVETSHSPTVSSQTVLDLTALEASTSKIYSFSGPQPRKPLARLSVERSQSLTPEKLSSLQKLNEKEPPQKSHFETQPSSGYVSASSSVISKIVLTSNVAAASQPDFEIKSVMSLTSSNFAPHSSSSVIGNTQKKPSFDEVKMSKPRGKLSECSTMVGSFSVTESDLAGTDEIDKVANEEIVYAQLQTVTSEFARPTGTQKLQADTTLGMSSYEVTLIEGKSQSTMQTPASPEVSDAKQKAALLKTMETVEVMDMDDEVAAVSAIGDQVQQQEIDKADVKEKRAKTPSGAILCGLYADTLGITVERAAEIIANDDWPEYYKLQKIMTAKLKEKVSEIEQRRYAQFDDVAAAVAAANDSDSSSSSSVIILSSPSPSPPRRHRNNAQLDNYEYLDGEEEEEEDDDENEDIDEDSAQSYNKKTGESSSSSIEIIEESSSSGSDKIGYVARAPQRRAIASVEGQDAQISSDDCETIQGSAEEDSEGADEDTNITSAQDEGSNSTLHSNSESVKSEGIIVEEADSSSANYEELKMHETIVYAESEEGDQQSQIDTTESDLYCNKIVFMQKDTEITIEELKVSAYNASTHAEVYEELDGDVFYCGVETSTDSVEMCEKREADIAFEVAGTSSKIAKQAVSVTEELSKELLKQSTRTANSEQFIKKDKEDKKLGEKVVSAAIDPQKEQETDLTTPADVIDADTIEKAENVSPAAAENAESEEPEEEEEEQISLRVDEGDLSEVEIVQVETTRKETEKSAQVANKSPERQKIETVPTESEIQKSTKSPIKPPQKSTQSPENNHAAEQQEAKNNKNDSDRDSTKNVTVVLEESSAAPITTEQPSRKRTRSVLNLPLEHAVTEKLASTPTRSRHSHRGTSVPPTPVDSTVNAPVNEGIISRRNTRGISMPPQTRPQQEQETAGHTPETRTGSRRSIHASSVPPSDETTALTGTPRTRRSMRGASLTTDAVEEDADTSTTVRSVRGTSVPPAAKIVTRRRSALLDAINESTRVAVDSPSTRTRSRMRLNSADSELDTSIVSSSEHAPQAKRTRRSSISSNVSEQPTTPSSRRTRTSIAAATVTETTSSEVGTPKSLHQTTRRQSGNTENLDDTQPLDEHNEHEKEEAASTSENTTHAALYSSARRLTRTQLAMMEKSAALSKNPTVEGLRNLGASMSSPTSKRVNKRRSSRSTHDSDDVESISSRISNASGAPNRRVTRSSVKEERDDDMASVASSLGSERAHKRRSKESKNSPNTTLSTIQEDEAEEETSGTKKRSKPTKKRYS